MRLRTKILLGFAVALVVAILGAYLHHLQLRAATEAYVKQIRASGGILDLDKLLPKPVASEKNGASLVIEAYDHLPSTGVAVTNAPSNMETIAPGEATAGWQQPDIRAERWATNTWEDLGSELAGVQDQITLLRSVVSRPALDFHLDYRGDPYVPLPHLSQLKSAALWLSCATAYDLHQGNPANASTTVIAILALVKGQANEPLLISQLLRMAIAPIAAGATWGLLQYPDVTDEDLARLQENWQSQEFIRPLEPALQFEQISLARNADQLRASSYGFPGWMWPRNGWNNAATEDGAVPWLKRVSKWTSFHWAAVRWRWFWSYPDEIRALRTLQVVIDATRVSETNNSFLPAQSFAHTNFFRLGLENEKGEPMDDEYPTNRTSATHNIFTAMNYSTHRALDKAQMMNTWRNVVVTAIALKRYRLRHHQLPESLDELTPEFLPAVPIDLMDGQPLRYRRIGTDRFLLYSVGENGKDDGGDPKSTSQPDSKLWQHGRDWVWPQAGPVRNTSRHD